VNQELIKFIELCLVDGVVSDVERKVIFRKSKELGVPEDECEILLEGLTSQNSNKSLIKPSEELLASRNDNPQISLDEIVKLDSAFSSRLMDFLNSIRTELDEITPENFNRDFSNWLGQIETELIYHTEKNDSSISSLSGFYYKNNEISYFGKIDGFRKYEGPPTTNRIVGEITGSKKIVVWNPKLKIHTSEPILEFCLTPSHLIQTSKTEHHTFFNGYSFKYEFGKETPLEKLNFFENNPNNPFEYFLDQYCCYVIKLDLYDIIRFYSLRYNPDWTMTNVKGMTSEQSKVVSKVSIELEKLADKLIQVCTESIDSISPYFYPYSVQWLRGNKGEMKINENFVSYINTVEMMIKTLIGIISLKNEMIISILEEDLTRFEYLKSKLEDSGLLLSYYESKTLQKSDDLVKTLTKGFNSIQGVLSDICQGMDNARVSLEQGMNEMNNSLNMNNVLTAIQTYQMYKVNLNTKSLKV
jgi:hypothetical protein